MCIDETGEPKQGQATDYVAKQDVGNLGKIVNGIVSVNAYAVVDDLTYALFELYKPQSRLKATDQYKSKPQLAIEMIRQIHKLGFQIERVLADSLDGESSQVIRALEQLHLPDIVAIRSNRGVLMAAGQRVRYNRWRPYDQPLSERPAEHRQIREIIFGQRRTTRYYHITKGSTEQPEQADSWLSMMN